MQRFMSLRLSTKLLILIVIIASFLRLYNITLLPPGLYPDEAMNGTNIQEALTDSGTFKVFYPENNGREGLFMFIQSFFVLIFGNEPWALRLASTFFGIFTVLGVYLLAKELFYNPREKNLSFPLHKKIALASSFLIATSFWHIMFSRIGFRAIMAPFFLTWSLYLFLLTIRRFLENPVIPNQALGLPQDPNQPKTIWGLQKNIAWLSALTGLVFGLGFYSYIAYRATPLVIVIMLAFWLIKYPEWRKEILKIFTIGAIAAIIAFAPLGMHFVKHPEDFMGRTSQVSVFSSQSPVKNLSVNIFKTIVMFNFWGDGNWRHNYAGRPEVFWPAGIALILGGFFAIKSLIKKIIPRKTEPMIPVVESASMLHQPLPPSLDHSNYSFAFLVILSTLIVSSLPVVISNEGIPHALRAIIMIPPIFILAGYGTVWFYEKFLKNYREQSIQKNKLVISFIILAMAFLTLEAYRTYFINWGSNPNVLGAFAQNYVDLGRNLNDLPKELPKYVIVNAGGTDVRGIPMPAMTTMFITDTFTPEKQREKNLFYVLPDKASQIPEGAFVVSLE